MVYNPSNNLSSHYGLLTWRNNVFILFKIICIFWKTYWMNLVEKQCPSRSNHNNVYWNFELKATLMSLVCHKKSYIFDICQIFEFLKYYIIFIYFQAGFSTLLVVLYVEKKSKFHNLTIRYISNTFSHDMPAT